MISLGLIALAYELFARNWPAKQVAATRQSFRLSGEIAESEREGKGGTLLYAEQVIMAWRAGNAQGATSEVTVLIIKEVPGKAKINPFTTS